MVEELSRVKELAPQHGSKVEEVLLFFQDESNAYRFSHVVQLYEDEKQQATAKGLTVPPDGLPDPTNVDGDLNYHLELVDLLGMCAKGPNPNPGPEPKPKPSPDPNSDPNPNPNLDPKQVRQGSQPSDGGILPPLVLGGRPLPRPLAGVCVHMHVHVHVHVCITHTPLPRAAPGARALPLPLPLTYTLTGARARLHQVALLTTYY